MANTRYARTEDEPAQVGRCGRHGIPDLRRATRKPSDRGTWSRICGLIHKLSSEDDDGPVSKIRY